MSKSKKPTITHVEILSYAILHVHGKLQDIEKKARTMEEMGDHVTADAIRNCYPWAEKMKALCQMYELETGTNHEFDQK